MDRQPYPKMALPIIINVGGQTTEYVLDLQYQLRLNSQPQAYREMQPPPVNSPYYYHPQYLPRSYPYYHPYPNSYHIGYHNPPMQPNQPFTRFERRQLPIKEEQNLNRRPRNRLPKASFEGFKSMTGRVTVVNDRIGFERPEEDLEMGAEFDQVSVYAPDYSQQVSEIKEHQTSFQSEVERRLLLDELNTFTFKEQEQAEAPSTTYNDA